jgi:hypothetical protein
LWYYCSHYVITGIVFFFFFKATFSCFIFQLEDVEIALADQVQRVSRANFAAAWEEAGTAGAHELEDTFSLSSMRTLDEAVRSIIQFLGMQPCERSDRVPEGKSSHTLYLAGRSLLFNIEVWCKEK